MTNPGLHLTLLGGVHITRDGGAVSGFVSSKTQALLCYLAVTGRPHQRPALADLLWGEMPEADAGANLRQALSNLRRVAGEYVLITRHEVAFDRMQPYCLDVEMFEQAVSAALAVGQAGLTQRQVEALRQAVALYRGELLQGVQVREAPAFEEWMLGQQQRLRELALQALHTLSAYFGERGEVGAGLEYTGRLLTLDPWREEAHRQMMLLLARGGQRSAALAQYAACRRVLAAELGVEPLPETTALFERIRAAGATRRHNLPAQPTPLVGRADELAQIDRLLSDPACRLLTLVGPGGVGKTRMALQAAANRAAAFLEGVRFVPLTSLAAPEWIVPALAEAMPFSFYGREDPQTQLLSYLREKEMLLVLDNFEHLLPPTNGGDKGGAALAAEILTAAPGVKMLVTSRERLGLRWEWLLEVEGLPYPAAEQASGADYSAVQLFVQAARQVQPRFILTPANQPPIAQICRLVEGMPLGLELAAAWVRVRPCEAIAQEIQRNLDFLSSTLADAPARHRSLRAVFEHSWRLLSAEESRVFEQLAVFQGGFDQQAAAQVAHAAGPTLAALVDKSLLRCDPAGRFDMHELLRQYAQERLAGSPQELHGVRDRHSAHFAAFLGQREKALQGSRQREVVEEIGREFENVRQGWAWAVESHKPTELACALEALYYFYEIRNRFQEGVAALEQAWEGLGDAEAHLLAGRLLARRGGLCYRLSQHEQAEALLQKSLEILRPLDRPQELGFALNKLGHVAYAVGQYERAEALLQEALALQQPVSDRRGMAASLCGLAGVSWTLGRHAQARRLAQESLDLCRELGDPLGSASALNLLGLVAHIQGAYPQARAFYAECLAIRESFNHAMGMALMLNNLGVMAEEAGEYQEARRLHDQSLALKRDVGDRRGGAASLNNLGVVAHKLGEYASARQLLQESLAICREIGDRRGEANALNNLGDVAHALGEVEQAKTLYQASVALKRALGDRRGVAHSLSALGDVAYTQAAYAEARQFYEQSLTLYTELADRMGAARCSTHVGNVLCAMRDYPAARTHFRQALHTALETHAAPAALEALVGLAALLLAEGRRARARKILALAAHHPAGNQETRTRAMRLLGEGAAGTGAEGHASGWEQLVEEMLAG